MLRRSNLSASVLVRAALHHLAHDVTFEAAGRQKTHLACPFCRIQRRACRSGVARPGAHVRVRCHAPAARWRPPAAGPGPWPASSASACVRRSAGPGRCSTDSATRVSLRKPWRGIQFVERGGNLRVRRGVRQVFGVAREFAFELDARMFALRQVAQRPALQRQARRTPCRGPGLIRQRLRQRPAAGCPAIHGPCFRSRARHRGSRAGTRARCPCPGRSSRRCRRTRHRSFQARAR